MYEVYFCLLTKYMAKLTAIAQYAIITHRKTMQLLNIL